MSQDKMDAKRRTLIKGIAMIPAAAALGVTSKAFAAMLSTDDPQAAALQYTENSTVDGQYCTNCALYTGDDSKGDCTLFPGKKVAGPGWCSAWVAG